MADDKASGGVNKKPPEEEIVIVEEGEGGGQQARQSGDEGTRQRADADEGGEGGEDERLGQIPGEGAGEGQGVSQAELSARQRRRQRERQHRMAERTELARLRQENTELRQKFTTQDARISNVETTTVESQIASLEAEIQRANAVMSRAMAAQNGDDFIQAQEIRDTLRDRLSDLRRIKEKRQERTATGGRAEGDEATRGRELTPSLGFTPTREQVANARVFLSRHPWYKINGEDDDSTTVTSIDNAMMAEGLNPSTAEYWQELERRIYEELPHHAPRQSGEGSGNGGGGENQGQGNGGQQGVNGSRRGAGPRLPGGGGSGGGQGSPTTFHLSAARKQALIDLGVWDDPEKRMKHIKNFIRWDKEHQATKQ